MAVKLNKRVYAHTKGLIQEGHFVWDERDAWSEDQRSTEKENEFIRQHGFNEYAKWHLGTNNEKAEGTKGRCAFPYGDFHNVHRCAVLSAESRSGQYNHLDVENAAAHLHEMIDEKQGKKVRKAHAGGRA
jgi:hypothetical protein